MTLGALVENSIRLFNEHGMWMLAAGAVFAVVGTLAAYIGRGGRTDADGRAIANWTIGLSATWLVLQVVLVAAWTTVFDYPLVGFNIAALAAPLVCVVGSGFGIHAVFPLNQLASYKTIIDVSLFFVAAALVVLVLSYFRGWGVIFHGGLVELALIGVGAYFLLRRLFRRAFMR